MKELKAENFIYPEKDRNNISAQKHLLYFNLIKILKKHFY